MTQHKSPLVFDTCCEPRVSAGCSADEQHGCVASTCWQGRQNVIDCEVAIGIERYAGLIRTGSGSASRRPAE